MIQPDHAEIQREYRAMREELIRQYGQLPSITEGNRYLAEQIAALRIRIARIEKLVCPVE